MDHNPFPTRPLRLPCAPLPENAPKLAEEFVRAAKQNKNIDLDYSPESLQLIDTLLQFFHDQNLTVNDFAEAIFTAGCYIGQVIIRNNQAEWVNGNGDDIPKEIKGSPLLVKFSKDHYSNPIGKAYKRYHYGNSDNILFFYKGILSH